MRDRLVRIGEINGYNFSVHKINVDNWAYGEVIYSDTGVWYHAIRGRDDIEPEGTVSEQRREVFRVLREWKRESMDRIAKRGNTSKRIVTQAPTIDGTYVRRQLGGGSYTGD